MTADFDDDLHCILNRILTSFVFRSRAMLPLYDQKIDDEVEGLG